MGWLDRFKAGFRSEGKAERVERKSERRARRKIRGLGGVEHSLKRPLIKEFKELSEAVDNLEEIPEANKIRSISGSRKDIEERLRSARGLLVAALRHDKRIMRRSLAVAKKLEKRTGMQKMSGEKKILEVAKNIGRDLKASIKQIKQAEGDLKDAATGENIKMYNDVFYQRVQKIRAWLSEILHRLDQFVELEMELAKE